MALGPDGSRTKFQSFLRRPVAWLGGVVAGAIALVLGNALVTQLSPIVSDHGPAITIVKSSTYRSDKYGNSVVFPSSATFSKAQIAELNRQDDPVAWLEGRGGAPPNVVQIQLVIVGNRTQPVRVMDVQTKSECTDPLDGFLFANPPAGADESEEINFDLDKADPEATFIDRQGKAQSYFPAKTISLSKGEQEVLLVHAETDKHFCRFRLQLTVLDGSDTSTIEVPKRDRGAFKVSAELPGKRYKTVYLGGVASADCGGDYMKAVDKSGEYASGWGCREY